MRLCGHLFESAQRAGGHANLATIQGDRLQIDVLASLGSDVGVAARLAKVGALTGEETDARHIK